MRFIQDTTLRVRPDKAEDFQAWYLANKPRLEADYPDGVSLFGMFYSVLGPNEGELHILEILDSYGALDRLAAHGKRPETRALEHEFDAFLDFSHGLPTTTLLKDIVDLTVVDVQVEAMRELVPA